mmetsp:Transcript_18828/g.75112  ORF Transcript_18828/g.75112 Transcript_18828/m.75112 type:complete len:119 (-) Transcript_18828:147-503(-)
MSSQVVTTARPEGGVAYDYEAWNTWHYGDGEGYFRNAREQIKKPPPSNPHAAFFARKTEAANKERETKLWHSIRMEKTDIVKRLRSRRIERAAMSRRAQAQGQTGATGGDDGAGCVIS